MLQRLFFFMKPVYDAHIFHCLKPPLSPQAIKYTHEARNSIHNYDFLQAILEKIKTIV